MLRVANIIEESRYGGPQARILGVAKKLKNQNLETVVVCPKKDSERFYKEAVKCGTVIHRINMRRLRRNPAIILRYFLSFPKEVFFLIRLFKKENIEVVHCNSARQFKGVVAGRLAGSKVIWHLQDTWSPRVIKTLFYLFALLPHYFIVAGESVRQYYLGKFPVTNKPVKIIQAPVDTTSFDPAVVKAEKRIASLAGLKIVSVGNVNPAKGYEHFINAVSLIDEHNIPLNYLVVGPYYKNQKAYYDKLLSILKSIHHVSFQFYGPSNNVRSVLKAADIYVCSSIHEASPISVWEAMSMSRAVVSTDVGDVKKIIQDGKNGFVVPTKDPKALADKISVLLKDRHLRTLLGARARSTAINHLDISICVRKHVEAYREIMKK